MDKIEETRAGVEAIQNQMSRASVEDTLSKESLHDEFLAHAADDQKNFDLIHVRMDTLATKEDIAGLKEDLKGYLIGGNIFKYAFNNGGKITAFFGVVVIILLIAKYGILGLIAFFVAKPPTP